MEKFIIIPAKDYNDLKRMVNEIHKNLVQPPVVNPIDDYISEKEAIETIGRKTTWFWNQRQKGTLPFRKMGGTVFYRRSDLIKLLE